LAPEASAQLSVTAELLGRGNAVVLESHDQIHGANRSPDYPAESSGELEFLLFRAQSGTTEMAYDVPPPENLPEPGFYYHFKHDPDGRVNNYAYYIYGVGHHTEDDCRPEDAFMQVYRPLYEDAYAYRHGGLFDLRPLRMFFEPAKWKGKEVLRFTRILEPQVIAQLEAIKARMYPALG